MTLAPCPSNAECNDSITTYGAAYYSDKGVLALGIVKDGHIVYSPYKEDGTLYSYCDVDVCNGLTLGDNYAYVATTFHPYFVGCWGPGNNPNFTQSCSTNGRACYEGGSVTDGAKE